MYYTYIYNTNIPLFKVSLFWLPEELCAGTSYMDFSSVKSAEAKVPLTLERETGRKMIFQQQQSPAKLVLREFCIHLMNCETVILKTRGFWTTKMFRFPLGAHLQRPEQHEISYSMCKWILWLLGSQDRKVCIASAPYWFTHTIQTSSWVSLFDAHAFFMRNIAGIQLRLSRIWSVYHPVYL